VANVVLVEAQQCAEPGMGERRARARQPIVVQPAEIDALLEVDLRVAGCGQRPVPMVGGIDVVGADDPRFRGFLLLGHGALMVTRFVRPASFRINAARWPRADSRRRRSAPDRSAISAACRTRSEW